MLVNAGERRLFARELMVRTMAVSATAGGKQTRKSGGKQSRKHFCTGLHKSSDAMCAYGCFTAVPNMSEIDEFVYGRFTAVHKFDRFQL